MKLSKVIFLILIVREWEQVKANRLLLLISALVVMVLALIIYLPVLQPIFKLTSLTPKQTVYMVIWPLLTALVIKLILKLTPQHN